ncbi:MAG TPA: arsenic resistance N-acetyltransferase ArsN2 [Chitinophagaceae bacterium]|nr:arsenic resistance N-acetyltransferase ArsN2 [Chitinophagaceae bacterium]
MQYKLIPADSPGIREQVIALLQQNKLPVSDIGEHTLLFAFTDDNDSLIGSAGLEIFDKIALVRSISVQPSQQHSGLGSIIIKELENIAREKSITELYLLTTTADKFFSRHGYSVVKRDELPETIRKTSEFTSVCPSSAIAMKKDLTSKKKILFVCVENSNRSQMSQAFAIMLGENRVEAYSAGSRPSGIINPKAIAAMNEIGYDLSHHESKSLEEVKQYAPFDVVVTMGCGDACPWMPAKEFIDWQIPDPRNMEPDEFNKVRDLIKSKVAGLIEHLQTTN